MSVSKIINVVRRSMVRLRSGNSATRQKVKLVLGLNSIPNNRHMQQEVKARSQPPSTMAAHAATNRTCSLTILQRFCRLIMRRDKLGLKMTLAIMNLSWNSPKCSTRS
jgi:hypothetical protein